MSVEQPLLCLTRFASPLSATWQSEQIERLTPAEQARLAQIDRPLRREQFVVGHALLRRMLCDDAAIAIDADGRLQIAANAPTYACIAHSADAVAVIVSGKPAGVDLESPRVLRDPGGAAQLMNLPAGAADSASMLRAWVAAEARLKAGARTLARVWCTTWGDCELAVAGVENPPLTGVFDAVTGIYNAVELQWERFEHRRAFASG